MPEGNETATSAILAAVRHAEPFGAPVGDLIEAGSQAAGIEEGEAKALLERMIRDAEITQIDTDERERPVFGLGEGAPSAEDADGAEPEAEPEPEPASEPEPDEPDGWIVAFPTGGWDVLEGGTIDEAADHGAKALRERMADAAPGDVEGKSVLVIDPRHATPYEVGFGARRR